jgi:hypothetical protein
MPMTAVEPCGLYRLGEAAMQADLEIGYATRGAQLVECDARRRLAVETATAEHALQDELKIARASRARPWWRFWP